jgi:peptidoglycan-associated lipoprotein
MKTSVNLKLSALIVALALAGCSSTKLDTEVPVESRNPAAGAGTGGAANAGANTGANAQSHVTPVDLTRSGGPNDAMSKLPHTVYFDFDSFVVKDEFRPTIEANAKALTADRRKHVAVEGHTDERGGREYNLALGQKRAEAVAKSMTLLGANDNQIEAVSFGEERPAVQGSDEAAWAKNRRAEIVPR